MLRTQGTNSRPPAKGVETEPPSRSLRVLQGPKAPRLPAHPTPSSDPQGSSQCTRRQEPHFVSVHANRSPRPRHKTSAVRASPRHKGSPSCRLSGRRGLQRSADNANPTPPGTSGDLNSRTASLHAVSGIKQPSLRSFKKSNGIGCHRAFKRG